MHTYIYIYISLSLYIYICIYNTIFNNAMYLGMPVIAVFKTLWCVCMHMCTSLSHTNNIVNHVIEPGMLEFVALLKITISQAPMGNLSKPALRWTPPTSPPLYFFCAWPISIPDLVNCIVG